MILVDTSVLIDFFNGKVNRESDLLDELLQRELVSIGDVILAEILQGFSTEAAAQRAARKLEGLVCHPVLTPARAGRAAAAYRKLRKAGFTPRGSLDVWIGSYCADENLTLLHRDRDFEAMKKILGFRTLR